ncbi:MAG: hypothetical protein MUO21_11390 [Nitrososphaeraceae archaeon]|nr:hypothetical protein [Nitrososphaeraceae archaeon]
MFYRIKNLFKHIQKIEFLTCCDTIIKNEYTLLRNMEELHRQVTEAQQKQQKIESHDRYIQSLRSRLSQESINFLDNYLGRKYKLKDLLEALIYYENNNLFGDDFYGKPFNMDMMIIGLNTMKAVEMSYDILDNMIAYAQKHKEINDDLNMRESYEITIVSNLRSFFGYVQRFTKIR